MANSLTLLDEALKIGERELKALKQGDMDVAGEAATERENLISEAWEFRSGVNRDELQQKLIAMQSVQAQLTDELKQLHASLKSQLLDSKKKSTGYRGYSQASGGSSAISMCLNKQG